MKQLLSRILPWMLCAALVACATAPDTGTDTAPEAGPDAARPSIADTESVRFLGKRFDLQFEDMAGPTRIYEYFTGDQTPEDWLELVEFQVYPVHPEANEPVDFARRIAAALRQRYPEMRFGLYRDEDDGGVLLDFFFPISTRKVPGKQFLEFNAFKFFRDQGSQQTLGFHYARNIESLSATRTREEVIADIEQARVEVLRGLAEFPLYRK